MTSNRRRVPLSDSTEQNTRLAVGALSMLPLVLSLLISSTPASSTPSQLDVGYQIKPASPVTERAEVYVVTKPKFREGYYVDREPGPRPHGGGVRDMRSEVWLDFEYGGRTYSTLWSAKGWRDQKTPAPVILDKNTTYRFLIRLEAPKKDTRCSVLKIWEGERLVWSRPARSDRP